MGACSSRSNRRWLWLGIVASFVATTAAYVAWLNHVEAATQAWIANAARVRLVMRFETICVIPAFEDTAFGKRVLAKRVLTLVTYNEQDAETILALPPCPIEVKITPMLGTPGESIVRLRQRFGDSVQWP